MGSACGLLFWCVWFKQKTAYEMRSSDWSSDVCSSDLVTQIAFEIEDVGVGDQRLDDHRPVEQVAGAQKGVHRPLSVGGDEDQAARGRRPAAERRRVVGDAERAQIVGENRAELVVGDLPDKGPDRKGVV